MFDQLVASLRVASRQPGEIRAGDVFGRLTATDQMKRNKHGSKLRYCCCSCGVEKWALESHLKTGSISSCGCYRRERAIQVLKTFAHPASKNVGRGSDGKFRKQDN